MQPTAFRRTVIPFVVSSCMFAVAMVSSTVADSAKVDTSDQAVQSRLLDDVRYLASDELQGRGVGTEGIDKAAEYIRDQFQQAGLDVTRVDGGAFQEFDMSVGTELGEPNVLTLIAADGNDIELQYDSDYRTCSFGGSGGFDAELVFCGYGIQAPDDEYDDFASVDVKGKVAVIMRRVPQQANPHGPFAAPHGGISRHADLRRKVSNAFREGAVGILLVNDPYSIRQADVSDEKLIAQAKERVVEAAEAFDSVDPDETEKFREARDKLTAAIQHLQATRKDVGDENDPLMRFGYGGDGSGQDIPVFHITRDTCNRLLKDSLGKSLDELETEIDSDLKPRSAALGGWKAVGETSLERMRADVKNVIGVIEGQGPLADETIVIGAHYDHLGMGGEGSLDPGSTAIHNGADDNASGTAALIELARRLGQRAEPPSRRLVFIAFTGEEMGLIGSAHYVKEPLFPLEETVAMFNMDMVGRLTDDKLTVFGIGTAPRWKQLVEQQGGKYGMELSLKDDGFGPSDQTSFYAKQIPVLHFFTGTHSDYHRPGDDWDKVNVEGMDRVIDMIEEIVMDTAAKSERPKYVEIERTASAMRSGNRPYFGSIPDFSGEGPGYSISGVAPESPAARGGLKGGDSIVELGGQRIGGLDDFDLALRSFSAGDEVDVVVTRDGEKVALKVILAKPR